MEMNTNHISTGFAVLNDLLQGRCQKIHRKGEIAALDTLLILNKQLELGQVIEEQRKQLFSSIESMTRDRVVDLVNELCPDSQTANFAFRPHRRRQARHFHLFLMLVRVAAPISRFVVIPVLGAMHRYPTNSEIDSALAWIPRFWFKSQNARLALKYLEVTGQLWCTGGNRPEASDFTKNVGILEQYSWQRQIVEVSSWRAAWNANYALSAGDPENPIYHSESIEFWLAHSGYYRNLRRTGRVIARSVLNKLGYVDTTSRPKTGIPTSIAFSLMLCIVAFSLYQVSLSRIHNWLGATKQFARAVDTILSEPEQAPFTLAERTTSTKEHGATSVNN